MTPPGSDDGRANVGRAAASTRQRPEQASKQAEVEDARRRQRRSRGQRAPTTASPRRKAPARPAPTTSTHDQEPEDDGKKHAGAQGHGGHHRRRPPPTRRARTPKALSKAGAEGRGRGRLAGALAAYMKLEKLKGYDAFAVYQHGVRRIPEQRHDRRPDVRAEGGDEAGYRRRSTRCSSTPTRCSKAATSSARRTSTSACAAGVRRQEGDRHEEDRAVQPEARTSRARRRDGLTGD